MFAMYSHIESPTLLFNDWSKYDQLMDETQFRSAVFQRPYQCLDRFSKDKRLDKVTPDVPMGTKETCLQCLLR